MSLCLVTGGAGFIGSHLVEALVRRGDEVRILDDLSTGRREHLLNFGPTVEVLIGSVLDKQLVEQALVDVDYVFHEAAIPTVPRSLDDPITTHEACATGTLALLNAARLARIKRVVYAASSSAYGNQPFATKREIDLPSPLSPYAAAKLAGEYYCRAFWESFGLETVCLRYFNVFGPRQNNAGPYAGVIPKFITQLLNRDRPTIHGDGLQSRDFTFVDNVVQANLLAAEVPGAVGLTMNIANGYSTTILELLATISEVLATNLPPIFAPPRSGDVHSSLADISLARRVLGYEPSIGLKQGLATTIEYYRRNRAGAA